MWTFLLKLGLTTAIAVGIGVVLALQQQTEIPYDRNRRPYVRSDDHPNRRLSKENKKLNKGKKDKNNQKQLLEDQINNGTVNCAICLQEVFFDEEIWSCQGCWNILHLSCVKQWADYDRSTCTLSWNCPTCRKHYNQPRLFYSCFCGRVKKPESVNGVTPHSCGQMCLRGCLGNCHPGPCSV